MIQGKGVIEEDDVTEIALAVQLPDFLHDVGDTAPSAILLAAVHLVVHPCGTVRAGERTASLGGHVVDPVVFIEEVSCHERHAVDGVKGGVHLGLTVTFALDVEDAFDRLVGPQSGQEVCKGQFTLAKTDIIHAGFFKNRLRRECRMQSTQNCGDGLGLANRVEDVFGAQPLSGRQGHRQDIRVVVQDLLDAIGTGDVDLQVDDVDLKTHRSDIGRQICRSNRRHGPVPVHFQFHKKDFHRLYLKKVVALNSSTFLDVVEYRIGVRGVVWVPSDTGIDPRQ